jgi:hypothetical protein
MTAKIRTKSNPTFIAAVARVHPELTAWRQRRKVREPIPEALWRAMVSLARRYGLSPVAQALKVNYMTLKQHLLASKTAQVSRSNPPASFVEVPLTGWPGGSQWVIELEDGGGSKLTVRLAQGDSASAVALAQGLWSQRS